MPDLIDRTLSTHPAGPGVCTGCTVPGDRTTTAAPCGIRRVFELAQQIRNGS